MKTGLEIWHSAIAKPYLEGRGNKEHNSKVRGILSTPLRTGTTWNYWEGRGELVQPLQGARINDIQIWRKLRDSYLFPFCSLRFKCERDSDGKPIKIRVFALYCPPSEMMLDKSRWISVLLGWYLKYIITFYYYWFKYFSQWTNLLIFLPPTPSPFFIFLTCLEFQKLRFPVRRWVTRQEELLWWSHSGFFFIFVLFHFVVVLFRVVLTSFFFF